ENRRARARATTERFSDWPTDHQIQILQAQAAARPVKAERKALSLDRRPFPASNNAESASIGRSKLCNSRSDKASAVAVVAQLACKPVSRRLADIRPESAYIGPFEGVCNSRSGKTVVAVVAAIRPKASTPSPNLIRPSLTRRPAEASV